MHRSDGSGTTFQFASYLTSANPEWNSKVGTSDSLAWPVGLGGKGNDGVAAFVKQTAGSIGYVEYAFAKQNNLTTTLVRNKDGGFPAPTAASFSAAAANAPWDKSEGNYMVLVDQAGKDSWPITGVTFVLMRKAPADPSKSTAVLKFFDWAFANGNAIAAKIDYIPLPDAVKTMVRGEWSQIQSGGKAVYTPKT